MASKRPQLNHEDLARLRWLLGTLLGLLAAWSVFFVEIEAGALLFAITVVGTLALLRPTWPGRLPSWIHRLAFPFVVGAFALDLYLTREPLPALIRLDLWLILYRLGTLRGRREDLQLIVLGLILIVVAGVMTVSVAFVAQILAFTACALALLFILTLAEVHPMPAAPPGHLAVWSRGGWRDLGRRLQAAADWRLVALTTGLFAAFVIGSALLFLAIPRFELGNSLFLDRWMSRKSQTGFSDQVRFGEVTAITQDFSLALTVDADPAELPAVPYWRMVVLDDYTQTGFGLSPAARLQLAQASTHGMSRGGARYRGDQEGLTLYLEPGISRYLPLLGNYYSLAFAEPQTFGIDRRAAVVALQRDPVRMLAYRVHGMETNDRLLDASFALERRREGGAGSAFLSLPISAEEHRQLVGMLEQVNHGADDTSAGAFGHRVARWLERRHAYALESAVPTGSGDPLVRWLNSDAAGHCEFFAGGLVVLARAAGYPARLVTGFKGGTWNSYSNSLMVRNSHAHAWCELFDDATGSWWRIDPTPGAEAAAVLAATGAAGGRSGRQWEDGWRARIDSLRVFWYRRIVSFNQARQMELISHGKNWLRQIALDMRAWTDRQAERMLEWLRRPWDLSRYASLAIGALSTAGLLLLWRMRGRAWWWRWRSRVRGTAGASDPVRREAGRWLTRWAQLPSPEAVAPEIHADLLRLRYGAPEARPEAAKVFRQAQQAWRRARRTARR